MTVLPGALWARMYERINAKAEAAGLGEERRRLLAEARGATVEIGAGTGLNVAYYPAELERLVLVEPDAHMAARLERRVREQRPEAEIVNARAEDLPFPDGAFDTAVVTFVLCTVRSPGVALVEIRRVLRPEGRFLFLEHVRSGDQRLARKQDRIRPFYRALIDCEPNRETLAMIASSGFAVESLRQGEVPAAPAVERPMIVGSASLGEQGE
jgi:ubiquinone/menaquinone biosynthesis C-methylase UbiE